MANNWKFPSASQLQQIEEITIKNILMAESVWISRLRGRTAWQSWFSENLLKKKNRKLSTGSVAWCFLHALSLSVKSCLMLHDALFYYTRGSWPFLRSPLWDVHFLDHEMNLHLGYAFSMPMQSDLRFNELAFCRQWHSLMLLGRFSLKKPVYYAWVS